MPALNFKAQFADDVASGKKRQTIRGKGKRRPPKVGEKLFLYTGQRTLYSRKLGEAACTDVRQILIIPDRKEVQLQGYCPDRNEQVMRKLPSDEIEGLARDDGFASSDEFFSFFADQYGKYLSGYLIKW